MVLQAIQFNATTDIHEFINRLVQANLIQIENKRIKTEAHQLAKVILLASNRHSYLSDDIADLTEDELLNQDMSFSSTHGDYDVF